MSALTIVAPVLILVGPTAIGKTDLSLAIARRWPCEIVSVDSMQVYRYLDIGTAKASAAERAEIVHHLIDIVNPDEPYDAARFAKDALVVLRDIAARGKIALVTGGSGLYLRALLEGLFPGVAVDPQVRAQLKLRLADEKSSRLHEELVIYDSLSAQRIHPNDSHRIVRALEVWYSTGVAWSEHLRRHRLRSGGAILANTLRIGLTCDRQLLYARINRRCAWMLASGLEEEVRSLLDRGYSPALKPFGAIGYRHMIDLIAGRCAKDEAARLLARDTRRYAKRQYTWFQTLPDLEWHQSEDGQKLLTRIEGWLRKLPEFALDGQ